MKKEKAEVKIMLDVMAFQETKNASMCGPASLKIVLNYYGINKSEAELAKLCMLDGELGTTPEDLTRVAKDLGMNAEIKEECGYDDIENWLKKGVPVIVDWFTSGDMMFRDSVPDGHYSVVAGLDGENIFLQDPEIGRMRKLDRESFMKVWFDFKGKYIDREGLVMRQLIAIWK